MHLSSISVSVGQSVIQVGMKGMTGSATGVHLHFEMSKGTWPGGYTQHVNPVLFIDDPVVRVVQTNLLKLGNKLVVDDVYGEVTINPVTDFQKKNGLLADGITGSLTMYKIEKEVESINETSPPTKSSIEKEGKVLELNQRQLEELANIYKLARAWNLFF